MKSTTSISISDDVLAATKRWASSEHRPLSHHIEMILGVALARRTAAACGRKPIGITPDGRKVTGTPTRKPAKKKEAAV